MVAPSSLISVDVIALSQLLQALAGPEHLIRELQATRSMHRLGHPNPIETLLDQVIAWGAANGNPNDGQPYRWAVMAPCGEGVVFSSLLDAKWTLTGQGFGADGLGHPTIGVAFRECYPLGLTLHRVQLPLAKGGAA